MMTGSRCNRDDILIGAATMDELVEEWKKVLEAYKKCGFTLNPKKTFVGLQQIEWHGFYSLNMVQVQAQKK